MPGCASSDEATKPITYSLTAKQNYEKGLAELKDENYPEAQKYFQFVKQKFPFSKFAVLAELAIADTQFARGNYTEAVDSYKAFIRLHPTHEKVENGYAAFKVGECYYKDMPDDIWLLPPSYEKDQSAVTDALRELDDFLKKYPDSPYMKDAEPMRKRGAEAAGRPRGLHRALLSGPRPPQGGGHCASRARSGGTRARGASPSCCSRWARPICRWATRARARTRSTRVVSEFPAAPQARRSELYLEFIHKRYGDSPQPRPGRRAPTSPRGGPGQWMSGSASA